MCGLILGPVGAGLGFVSRRNIRASHGAKTGEGMALAGMIIGILATVLALAILAWALSRGGNPLMPYGGGGAR